MPIYQYVLKIPGGCLKSGFKRSVVLMKYFEYVYTRAIFPKVSLGDILSIIRNQQLWRFETPSWRAPYSSADCFGNLQLQDKGGGITQKQLIQM